MSLSQAVITALEARGNFKKEGANQYRCFSPFRPDSDGYSFVLTIQGEDKGIFCDHGDDDRGGTLQQLATFLGIEHRREVSSTKRPYEGLADYAQAHGISAEELARWGWHQVSHKGRPALEFPTKTGKRWRFLDGSPDKSKFESERGYSSCWYGSAEFLYRHAFDLAAKYKPGWIVICNGEVSVIAARAVGLPALAFTGGEKSEIPFHLLKEFQEMVETITIENLGKPEILIAMDCDRQGRRAGLGIKEQLCRLGYKARALDLGLSDKGDLADFCMLYGAAAAEKLFSLPGLESSDAAPSPEDRRWIMITEQELDNLPPVEWLVPGEIPKQSICALTGASNAGKSFLALDYALKLAEQGIRAIYVAAEGESGYSQRVKAWRLHHKQSKGRDFIRYVLGAVNLFDGVQFEDFLSAIALFKPEFVVIDTLSMAMVGGDENNSKDMMIFLAACKQLKNQLSCSVMLVHHLTKDGLWERGNGHLRNQVDTMIRVDPDDDLIKVQSVKTRDRDRFEPKYLKKVEIDLGLTSPDGQRISSLVLLPADKVVQQADDPLTKNQRTILDALNMETFSDGAMIEELKDVTGLANSSLFNALNHLIKLEYAEKEGGKNKIYRITDEGRGKLGGSKKEAVAIGQQAAFSLGAPMPAYYSGGY